MQTCQSCHVLSTKILAPPGKVEQKIALYGDDNNPSPPDWVDKIVTFFPRWIPLPNFGSHAPTVLVFILNVWWVEMMTYRSTFQENCQDQPNELFLQWILKSQNPTKHISACQVAGVLGLIWVSFTWAMGYQIWTKALLLELARSAIKGWAEYSKA